MTFSARTLGVPAAMSAPAAQPVVGDSFHVTIRAIHIFWGTYPARVPNLQHVLAGQLVGGRGVHNLGIRVRRRWSDILVTVLTAGIVTPTSVTFDGIVARASP
ncbi:MAG: hypothetical protein HY705_04550 [Gemmatimonadetes bacterium]|nr:hypothetical protein [Gemmatimonadota bacterium]